MVDASWTWMIYLATHNNAAQVGAESVALMRTSISRLPTPPAGGAAWSTLDVPVVVIYPATPRSDDTPASSHTPCDGRAPPAGAGGSGARFSLPPPSARTVPPRTIPPGAPGDAMRVQHMLQNRASSGFFAPHD